MDTNLQGTHMWCARCSLRIKMATLYVANLKVQLPQAIMYSIITVLKLLNKLLKFGVVSGFFIWDDNVVENI